jgi:hypothetical protein
VKEQQALQQLLVRAAGMAQGSAQQDPAAEAEASKAADK